MTSSTTPSGARAPASYGKLYRLLEVHFPDHRSQQNVFDIPRLAKDMGFAHETLYRAVRGGKHPSFPDGILKVPVALTIIKFSHANHPEQPLYWDDLVPFVLPEFDSLCDPLGVFQL